MPALPDCKQAACRAQHTHAGQTHDNTRQQNAAHTGDEDILELHIEDGSRQRTGPCAGPGQRDAHEEQQRHSQALAGLFFQLTAALSPLTIKNLQMGPMTGLL